jgi:hypothetical protein
MNSLQPMYGMAIEACKRAFMNRHAKLLYRELLKSGEQPTQQSFATMLQVLLAPFLALSIVLLVGHLMPADIPAGEERTRDLLGFERDVPFQPAAVRQPAEGHSRPCEHSESLL